MEKIRMNLNHLYQELKLFPDYRVWIDYAE